MSSTADLPLVVIPVYGKLDLAERAIRAVDRHTDPRVHLLVIDDAGPQPLDEARVRAWIGSSRPVEIVSHPTNTGFVRTVNEAFSHRDRRDVALVTSDVVVYPGWLEGLVAEAVAQDVASVTAATNNGSIATIAGGPEIAQWEDLTSVSADAAAAGPGSFDIPVAVGHCLYVTDRALADVGVFDPAFSPGYGEEVDWALRAKRRGWRHVLAPSVVVWHDGGQSFDRVPWRKRAHELKLLRRYPREFVSLRRYRPPLGQASSS